MDSPLKEGDDMGIQIYLDARIQGNLDAHASWMLQADTILQNLFYLFIPIAGNIFAYYCLLLLTFTAHRFPLLKYPLPNVVPLHRDSIPSSIKTRARLLLRPTSITYEDHNKVK